MLLRALRLNHVRNLAPLQLNPGNRFNVFSGDNGQGKTNLLESIYVAGSLRSFRTHRLADLIAFGEPEAFIRARVLRGGRERSYQVTVRERSRVVRLDDKAVRPISQYFGDFNIVLFAPEDLLILRGSPKDRRTFLDRAIFHRRPAFLAAARDYEKVLKNRNALLREAQGRVSSINVELLDVYDTQLADLAMLVTRARRAYLDEIRPRFQSAFDAITHMGIPVDLVYQTRDELQELTPDSLAEAVAALLASERARDIARGTTSTGPHRDDLLFTLGNRPAGSFASQGQMRALVLAWKTAEMDLLADAHGEPPILLLDDVSSELDLLRNQFLFDFLRQRNNQCFITTTHPKHVLLDLERTDFTVEEGHVTRQNK